MDGKYLIGITLVIILLFTPVVYGNDLTNSLSEDTHYYRGNYSLNLNRFALSLPDEDARTFSPEGQEKLFDLAERYGDKSGGEFNNIDGLRLPQSTITPDINSRSLSLIDDENSDNVLFKPYPDMMVNTEYAHLEDDEEQKLSTNINLNYQMSSNMFVRAGYGLSSRHWQDTNSMDKTDLDSEKEETEQENDTEENEENSEKEEDTETIDSGKEDSKDRVHTEPVSVFNREINQESSVGISYYTNNHLIFSADYVHNNNFSGTEGDSTIFGLEYLDDSGTIRAQHQIDRGDEMKQTTTGVEFDVRDLATFSASYNLLDPQYIKDALGEESVWDFGLDINLSEYSSFSVGYQLIPAEETDKERDNSSNINASFKVNF